MRRSEALAYRARIEHAAEQQSDADALQSIDLFRRWKADEDAEQGDRRSFGGKLYRCLQSHHTQAGWTPDITPALWTEVSVEEWPEWVQPLGAQDAYNTGDKVTHNGSHWISTADSNVWEPGVFGWNEVQ